jgi:Kdo2-lipid IVA lauroyltransferase/acyltransferase
LPLDCASALGVALARRIGPFLGVSKHARRNISRAFPELSQTEIARVAAGMWDNLGRVAAEYPDLGKIRVFEPGGRVETHGFEHVDRAVAAGRRMIVFSRHMANRSPRSIAGNNPLLAGPHDRAAEEAAGFKTRPIDGLVSTRDPVKNDVNKTNFLWRFS